MTKFTKVAVGGTFDELHRGHKALLDKAFEVGERVVVGLTTDSFVAKMGKPHKTDSYIERLEELKAFLKETGLADRAEIVPLNDPYGLTLTGKGIDALVVSKETEKTALKIMVKLCQRMSALNNVELGLKYANVGNSHEARDVLGAVGLGDRLRHHPMELSGGEQQRVAIARAIVNNPEIILADEPTGNLDPELAFEIVSLFKEINKQGTTVIIGSHDRELIRHFGDNILFRA